MAVIWKGVGDERGGATNWNQGLSRPNLKSNREAQERKSLHKEKEGLSRRG